MTRVAAIGGKPASLRFLFGGAAAAALFCAAATASSTAAWEMNSYQDFVKGTFSGVSLSRDGRMSLAPRMDSWFSSDQPAIWAVAAAPDGSLYLGSGHRGRLFRVEKSGKSSVVWSAREPEIFAVAVAPDGAVYAGTSPDGKIYRIRGGNAEEYFAPGTKYIWSLAVGHDGALYAGTGDGGRVFRVTAAGRGEVWYETGQTHVTSLALDAEGRLLAGSEPNGVLYRITGKDKAFVLYDADLPEIRTIVPGPDGSIYAAALGGSVAQRAGAAATAAGSTGAAGPVTAPATSITVTDEAQTGIEIKPKAEAAKSATTSTTSTISSYTQPTELIGVEKSAVYRINPDNTVEKLWSSKDENAYDLLLSGDSVLFSTDAQGRIYRLTPDRRLTLVAQTNEGETTRLLSVDGSLIAATGTMGKLFRLTEAAGAQGFYESPVHDAGTVARWGQLTWRADKPGEARLTFRTRSGNSARPDKTWSDWSAPLADPRAAAISSPNARFLQWRAEFGGNGAATPVLTSVSAAYLPQNTPPVVKAVTVMTQLAAPAAGTRQAPTTAPASTGVYSVTVTDTGDAAPATSAGTPTQVVGRGLAQQIVISWQAEDPDSDRLVYGVWFRADEDNQWKLLRANFAETSLTLEGDVFADGKYFFRVVASDKLANTAATAREGEMVSPPVLFDNTPPTVTASAPRRSGSRLEIDVSATDAASPLRHAEYSVDANPWIALEAADGIVDGQSERFTVRLDNPPPGEHLVVIRVYDSSNNAGLAKVLVR